MRKWIAACVAVLLVFSVTACTSPFQNEPEPESTAERTYVITTKNVEGLNQMCECIAWQDNSLCAVHALGSRGNYSDALQKLYQSYFSSVDFNAFSAIKQIDVGGDEAFLVVPRFNSETISVFKVAVDAEETVHILTQCAEVGDAFILFCNTTDDPNTQIQVTLSGGDSRNMRKVLTRDVQSGDLAFSPGIQPLKKP